MPIFSLDSTEKHALLERFLRYVVIDTASDDSSTTHPSTKKPKEWISLEWMDAAVGVCLELVSVGLENSRPQGRFRNRPSSSSPWAPVPRVLSS